jgi:hypothetical protein
VVEVQLAREEDHDRDVVVPQVAVPVAQAVEQESPSRALPSRTPRQQRYTYTRWDELHVPWRRGHVLSWWEVCGLEVANEIYAPLAARRRRPRCRLPQEGIIWRRALLQPTYDVVARDYLCGVKHR